MKIFYLTLKSNRKDLYDENGKEYNFTEISETISSGILKKFDDAEIFCPNDIVDDNGLIPEGTLKDYDLCLCDLTTSSPNVSFVAGKLEGLGIPIIYFTSSESSLIHVARHNRHLQYSDTTLNNEFIDELNNWIEEAKNKPKIFKANVANITPVKPKAFISYSHSDSEYLKRLQVHLKPLEKKGLVDIWQDTKIKTGDKWEEKIAKALSEANIAILLISADFLASDFIVDNELPPLLTKAEVQGTKIVPVIISPCRFSRDKSLSSFQTVNTPDNPLSLMTKNERESIYDKIAADIESALKE